MLYAGEGRELSAAGARKGSAAIRKRGKKCFTGCISYTTGLCSMVPFKPLFRSPQLQTIAAHFWPRPDASAEFPVERRLYRTEADTQVLVCSQRPHGTARGELFMVHGLEGSGQAGYIRSLSTAALRAGFAA